MENAKVGIVIWLFIGSCHIANWCPALEPLALPPFPHPPIHPELQPFLL